MNVGLRVHGLPGDDWPLNGKYGWGMGSRVQFFCRGPHVLGNLVGVVVGAVLYGEDEDWTISIKCTYPRNMVHEVPLKNVKGQA